MQVNKVCAPVPACACLRVAVVAVKSPRTDAEDCGREVQAQKYADIAVNFDYSDSLKLNLIQCKPETQHLDWLDKLIQIISPSTIEPLD